MRGLVSSFLFRVSGLAVVGVTAAVFCFWFGGDVMAVSKVENN